jgi:hypothetical protein
MAVTAPTLTVTLDKPFHEAGAVMTMLVTENVTKVDRQRLCLGSPAGGKGEVAAMYPPSLIAALNRKPALPRVRHLRLRVA